MMFIIMNTETINSVKGIASQIAVALNNNGST